MVVWDFWTINTVPFIQLLVSYAFLRHLFPRSTCTGSRKLALLSANWSTNTVQQVSLKIWLGFLEHVLVAFSQGFLGKRDPVILFQLIFHVPELVHLLHLTSKFSMAILRCNSRICMLATACCSVTPALSCTHLHMAIAPNSGATWHKPENM